MQKLVEQKYKKIEEHERVIQRKREEVNKGTPIQLDLMCNQLLAILKWDACSRACLCIMQNERKEREKRARAQRASAQRAYEEQKKREAGKVHG